jgi:hypothetical protein
MARRESREIAARCWCTPETSGIEMDARLAEALADALDKVCAERDRLSCLLDMAVCEWADCSITYGEMCEDGCPFDEMDAYPLDMTDDEKNSICAACRRVAFEAAYDATQGLQGGRETASGAQGESEEVQP